MKCFLCNYDIKVYTGSCLGFEREGMEGVGQSLASPKGRSSIIAATGCLCNRDWLCVATSVFVYRIGVLLNTGVLLLYLCNRELVITAKAVL